MKQKYTAFGHVQASPTEKDLLRFSELYLLYPGRFCERSCM